MIWGRSFPWNSCDPYGSAVLLLLEKKGSGGGQGSRYSVKLSRYFVILFTIDWETITWYLTLFSFLVWQQCASADNKCENVNVKTNLARKTDLLARDSDISSPSNSLFFVCVCEPPVVCPWACVFLGVPGGAAGTVALTVGDRLQAQLARVLARGVL